MVEDITFNVGSKVTTQNDTKKEILNSDIKVNNTAVTDEATAYIGEVLDFKLTAPIVGSFQQRAKKFVMVDDMADGFTRIANTVTVTLKDSTGRYSDWVLGAEHYTLTDGATDADDFTITLSAGLLGQTTDATTGVPTILSNAAETKAVEDEYSDPANDVVTYYDYTDIVVEYKAEVNTDAVLGADGNANTLNVSFKKDTDTDTDPDRTFPEDEVKVYTYGIEVTKKDAEGNKIALEGAEFTLYSDEACTQIVTLDEKMADGTVTELRDQVQTTDANGQLWFDGLKAGTYYLKETKAPAGYNLDPVVRKLVIGANTQGTQTDYTDNYAADYAHNPNGTYTFTYDASDVATSTDTDTLEGYFDITITNIHLFMPLTGSSGTLMLTIGGAALVLVGGALLFVLFRKKKTVEE